LLSVPFSPPAAKTVANPTMAKARKKTNFI
jgi:hypothetical protein